MTFEEYMRSDEGKFRIDQFRRRKKIIARATVVLIVVLVLFTAVELFSDALPEESENPVYRILFYVALGVSFLGFIVLFCFQAAIAKQNAKSAESLARAVMLFWRENPVPWENFLRGEEMIFTVDHIYSYGENKKPIRLEKLILSCGDPAFEGFSYSLGMAGWEDILEGWIDAFLLSSMLTFLNHMRERGQEISLLRLEFACEGKTVINKKNRDSLYISKGKVTTQARYIFRVAEILREKATFEEAA